MENLPSTSLTYQMFRYRDWSTPPPSKQCWGEETLLGQGKGYRGAQTTTCLGETGKGEKLRQIVLIVLRILEKGRETSLYPLPT